MDVNIAGLPAPRPRPPLLALSSLLTDRQTLLPTCLIYDRAEADCFSRVYGRSAQSHALRSRRRAGRDTGFATTALHARPTACAADAVCRQGGTEHCDTHLLDESTTLRPRSAGGLARHYDCHVCWHDTESQAKGPGSGVGSLSAL